MASKQPLSVAAKKLKDATTRPISQAQIAEKLGVTQQAVSSWLHGRTKPEPAMMLQIERDFGIPMQEWLAEAEPSKRARRRAA